jgi:hypothetical protein
MGFGLLDMKEDDEVSFPFSGPTPVVLRDIGNGFHQFVGEAYVHGITQGEVMKYVEERSRSGSLHFIDVRVKVTGRRRISLSFTEVSHNTPLSRKLVEDSRLNSVFQRKI